MTRSRGFCTFFVTSGGIPFLVRSRAGSVPFCQVERGHCTFFSGLEGVL